MVTILIDQLSHLGPPPCTRYSTGLMGLSNAKATELTPNPGKSFPRWTMSNRRKYRDCNRNRWERRCRGGQPHFGSIDSTREGVFSWGSPACPLLIQFSKWRFHRSTIWVPYFWFLFTVSFNAMNAFHVDSQPPQPNKRHHNDVFWHDEK